MISFVNTGLDEQILKSMPVEDVSEDLEKAMNKQGMVQKEVQVKGKNGTFTRKQWVKASDVQTSGSNTQSANNSNSDDKSYSGDEAVDKVCNLKSGSVIEITTKLKDGSTITGEYTLQNKKYALGTMEAWVKTGGNHYQNDFAPNKSTVKSTIGLTGISIKIKKAAGELVQPSKQDNLSPNSSKSNRERLTEQLNKKYGNKVTLGTLERKANLDKGKHEAFLVSGYYKDSKGHTNHIHEIQYLEKKQLKELGKRKPAQQSGAADGFTESGDGSYTKPLVISNGSESYQIWAEGSHIKGSLPGKQDSHNARDINDFTQFGFDSFDEVKDYVKKYFFSNKNREQSTSKPEQSVKFDKTKSGKVGGIQIGNELATVVKTITTGAKKIREVTDKDTGKTYSIYTDVNSNKPDGIVAVENNTQNEQKPSAAQKLSPSDAKKKTQEITKGVLDKKSFMEKAKAQGITWKENDHEGINWMRCCMAMNKHFENGGTFNNSPSSQSSSDNKAVPKKVVIDSKTFKIDNSSGTPTISISMYDTQKRLSKVEKYAKENNIKVVYTH